MWHQSNGGTQHVDYSDGWTSIKDGTDQGRQSGVVLGKASLAQEEELRSAEQGLDVSTEDRGGDIRCERDVALGQ